MNGETNSREGPLGKYAAVVDAIAANPEGMSLTDIANATHLPKGTVHRLLKSLQSVGYVAMRDARKHYVLGSRLLRVLYVGAPQRTIGQVARPILERLVSEFNETAFLAKLVDTEVHAVAIITPDNERQSYVHPGRTMPLHAAASAKAIWAYQESERLSKVLTDGYSRFTGLTITDRNAVEAELGRVRKHGYAVCDQELDPGVLSYACPVTIDGPGTLFSVGIVGVRERLNEASKEQVVHSLRTAADELSTELPHSLKNNVVSPVSTVVSQEAAS